MKRGSITRSARMVAVIWTALLPVAARAAGTGMPWEGPLQQIADSVSGPVARALGILAIILAGLGIAFSEGGSSTRKLLFVVLGLSVAYAAATWGLGFLGFGGGSVI